MKKTFNASKVTICNKNPMICAQATKTLCNQQMENISKMKQILR